MKGWTSESIERLNLKTSIKANKDRVKKAQKVKTIPQLVKALDDIFSIWVRKSNEDENGVIRCFTCNRPMTFNIAENGHYVGRQYKSVRWEPKNCEPQCRNCNGWNEGEKEKFGKALELKYGEGHCEMLNQKKNNRVKLERFILQTLIEDYKTKIAQLNR